MRYLDMAQIQSVAIQLMLGGLAFWRPLCATHQYTRLEAVRFSPDSTTRVSPAPSAIRIGDPASTGHHEIGGWIVRIRISSGFFPASTSDHMFRRSPAHSGQSSMQTKGTSGRKLRCAVFGSLFQIPANGQTWLPLRA